MGKPIKPPIGTPAPEGQIRTSKATGPQKDLRPLVSDALEYELSRDLRDKGVLKLKKVTRCYGKNFEKYLKTHTGSVLESLLDIVYNSDNERVRLDAIALWLSKSVEDKVKSLNTGGNTTNVLVLPSVQVDGISTIELPNLKIEEAEINDEDN